MVALREGDTASVRTIDSVRELRLDQASEVITIARRAEATELTPAAALSSLDETLAARPRFGTPASIVSHAVLTIGLGLVIHPAAVELGAYAVLGALVGVDEGVGEAVRHGRLPARRRGRGRRVGARLPGAGAATTRPRCA